jgi:hypothetical protein
MLSEPSPGIMPELLTLPESPHGLLGVTEVLEVD